MQSLTVLPKHTGIIFRLFIFLLAVLVASALFSAENAVVSTLLDRVFVPADLIKRTAPLVEQRPRGVVLDQDGAQLARTIYDYQIGAAPGQIIDAQYLAAELAPLLQTSRAVILDTLTSSQAIYTVLAGRVSAEIADEVAALQEPGLYLDPLPRRFYPNGNLLCHVLGFVNFENFGGAGVEAYYDTLLTGGSPNAGFGPGADADLQLTIDQDVQTIVERHLEEALETYDSQSGTVIVMNPQTGKLLALANSPGYDPNTFYSEEPELFVNPAISTLYEPGDVFQLITMAAALNIGIVQPDTPFYDSGVFEAGGIRLYNWNQAVFGDIDMTAVLAHGSVVGAATLAEAIGPLSYYNYLRFFGFDGPTGIDLAGERDAFVLKPGDAGWTEASMFTTAFGQGIAVTPMQMINAVAAIANGGLVMQPYVVDAITQYGKQHAREPVAGHRILSEQNANKLIEMSIASVGKGAFDGYLVAGKSGTAQIAAGGVYHPEDTIASYVGWFPAYNPELIILVKLDRPRVARFGQETAAPTFARLAAELAITLQIAPNP